MSENILKAHYLKSVKATNVFFDKYAFYILPLLLIFAFNLFGISHWMLARLDALLEVGGPVLAFILLIPSFYLSAILIGVMSIAVDDWRKLNDK